MLYNIQVYILTQQHFMKLPVDGITELYISLHCTLNIYIYNIYIYMPGCDYK